MTRHRAAEEASGQGGGRRRRGFRRGSIFVLWVVAASLALLEAVLQVLGLLFSRPPPALGSDVDPAAIRVMAVGDSWIEGAEAQTGMGFVDHLGRELPEVAGGAPVQVFNLGRTGANSAYVALTVMDGIDRIRPSLVVVLVGQNNASNFYRVAEVEERIGQGAGRTRLRDRSKVVKLARILAANARGGSGYGGGRTPESLPEIPPLVWDDQGQPVVTDPLLSDPQGLRYLRRSLDGSPPSSGSRLRDLAWRVLFATAGRDLVAAGADGALLAGELGWQGQAGPSAPLAATETELLARYAMLRLARARSDWPSVRYHGGAAIGYEPRNALSDMASAEAHLLAGDWRTARALLVAAHNRAPGLIDAIDLAARFPDAARDPDVYEVLEFQPAAPAPPAWERALIARHALHDPESAVGEDLAWLASRPDDLPIRVDLASWLLENGRHEEADALMGVTPDRGTGRIPDPPGDDPDLWRFHVARATSSGDREYALDAATAALALPASGAPLLGAIAEAFSAHEVCEALRPAADRWFRASADSAGYARVVAPCMEPGASARRLSRLRAGWGPLGYEQQWTALVKAGRQPFDLLYRDLDLVLAEARRVGATVVLLDYPNPSEDHTALRDILADYAQDRPVVFLDLYSRFASAYGPEQWQALLGPNGHCNEDGYRVMADVIKAEIGSRKLLEAP